MLSLALPTLTWAHKVPAWLKLFILFMVSTILFPVDSIMVLGLALAGATGLTVSLGKVALRRSARMIIPLAGMIALLLTFHVIFDSIWNGLVITCRLLALVMLANFVTMSTPLTAIMQLMEKLLYPLERVGMNARAISLAIGLVVRFTPVLLQRGTALIEAWKVRSTKRAWWQLIAPIGLSAFDDATFVADALRARGGLNRIRHKDNSGT